MPGIVAAPQVLGASLAVPDAAALALVDVSGMTLGTGVYVSSLDLVFSLKVSAAALSSAVVAVLGNTGLRWAAAGSTGGIVAAEQVNAAVLLGRADLVPYFRDLAAEGINLMQNVIAGTANWGTGEIQLGTGAVGGTTAAWITGATGGNYSTAMRAAGDFYVSGRFRCVTTPTTGTVVGIGGVEATFASFLRVGVNFATSAAFFSVVGSGGIALVSAVAIDTLAHTFRCWRIGATTFLQIDGGAIVSSGTSAFGANLCPCIITINGTAADQRGGYQWLFFAAPPV